MSRPFRGRRIPVVVSTTRRPRRPQQPRANLPRELRCAADPPTVKSHVWLNRVIDLVGTFTTTATTITIDELTAGSPFSIRIRSIKIWSDPGLGNLVVTIYDPTTATTELSRLNDSGTYTSRPSVGYSYGERIFSTPLEPLGNADNKLASISSPTSGGYVIHVHCMLLTAS